MKYSNQSFHLLIFCLVFALTLFSCRKKDERYEGNYSGTERHTYLDSGETVYSLDTTYNQEVEITYSKKFYTLNKVFVGAGNVYSISRKSFSNHEYSDEGGFIKFDQDSVHWQSTQNVGWDTETWDFYGKRN